MTEKILAEYGHRTIFEALYNAQLRPKILDVTTTKVHSSSFCTNASIDYFQSICNEVNHLTLRHGFDIDHGTNFVAGHMVPITTAIFLLWSHSPWTKD